MIKNTLLFIYVVCSLGCANKISVTYYSDPSGAKFYESGNYIGVAPMTLSYEPTPDFLNGGCMLLRPFVARWVSGAENDPTSINVCAFERRNIKYTFFRPKNIAGAEVDAQYAAQYEYQLEMQRQRSEEATRRSIQTLNAISNSFSGSSNNRGSSGGYQTKDMNGVLVNSNDCYQTKDSLGVIVKSAGCYK